AGMQQDAGEACDPGLAPVKTRCPPALLALHVAHAIDDVPAEQAFMESAGAETGPGILSRQRPFPMRSAACSQAACSRARATTLGTPPVGSGHKAFQSAPTLRSRNPDMTSALTSATSAMPAPIDHAASADAQPPIESAQAP